MNEETFQAIDRWMGEEGKLRRLRAAQRKALAERVAKERGWAPNDPRLLFLLTDRQPGEGRIVRTPEGNAFTIHYTPAMIERVAKERPWMLEELLKELNGGQK